MATLYTWPTPTKVEIDDKDLIFFFAEAGTPTARAEPTKTLVSEFAALTDKTIETTAAFASRYGLLSICEAHNVPSTHFCDVLNEDAKVIIKGCRPRGYYKRIIREPYEGWQYYSRKAGALQRLAAALKHGQGADPHDWNILNQSAHTTPEIQRLALTHEIDAWIQLAGIRPSFVWHDTNLLHLETNPATLFGAVTLALAEHLTHPPR